MREWLTVIIVLLIIGIVLDGIRRVRAARRERIHMASNLPHAAESAVDELMGGSEFPSGGARIAGYRHPDDAENSRDNPRVGSEGVKKAVAIKPTISTHGPVESAPVLMEPVEDDEPAMGDFTAMDLDDDDDLAVAAPPRVAAVKRAEQHKAPVVRDASASAHVSSNVDAAHHPVNSDDKEPAAPEEVIVINVMAHQGQYFEGNQLLDVLSSQNMRFGFMDIFHRHKNEDGSGESLFSLANIVKPGTFDLSTMDDFTTPGISMFMMLPLKGDSVAAFGLMARTAKMIAETLDGELKDEHRSVMTQQTFEHCRQRVIEFERKRRLNR